MDDQIIIEADVRMRAKRSVKAVGANALELLGPAAINAAKDNEEGTLEEGRVTWGLQFDTDRATVALPEAKLQK
eukprot:16202747-Heterocapsa_arctica.AAC.1